MGYWEYLPLAEKYQIPITVTGFEPLDIVQGILETVESLEAGTPQVKNAYIRAVSEQGNQSAQAAINQVFQSCDRKWRGIGVIPDSGWCIRPELDKYDAEKRFQVETITAQESPLCISGLVLQGEKKPDQCEAFGTLCTPEQPLGATMVSDEGACAAYYRYRKQTPSEVS
jgi:hydrogenase expression/formation protein HypD